MKQFTIKQGNNIDTLKTYPDNHFDSIVTDPPYGIEFLGKDWDSNTGAVETWQECFRVLKPGGYLLAFSAARTYHHLATNIEGVGFEIRDQLMWLYASGFPKAQDIGKAIQRRQGVEKSKPSKGMNAYPEDVKNGGNRGVNPGNITAEDYPDKKDEIIPTSPEAKQWSGWKTALKPAHEPIVMARKPFKGSAIDNVLTHGVGALNIDATRVGAEEMPIGAHEQTRSLFDSNKKSAFADETVQGRFPSNVLGEVEGYQKFFYCPKVSRKERHCGFEAKEIPAPFGDVKGCYVDGERFAVKHQEYQGNSKKKADPLAHIPTNPEGIYDIDKGAYIGTKRQEANQGIPPNKDSMLEEMGGHWAEPEGGDPKGGDPNMCVIPHIGKIYVHGLRDEYIKWCKANNKPTQNMGNNHPTVKPVELMKYLVKLVTPSGGKVLDPFCGSGSTGMACIELDYDFTGCELDEDYVNIAETRIEAWYEHTQPDTTFDEIFEEK